MLWYGRQSNLKERQAIKYTQQCITSGADAVAFDGMLPHVRLRVACGADRWSAG